MAMRSSRDMHGGAWICRAIEEWSNVSFNRSKSYTFLLPSPLRIPPRIAGPSEESNGMAQPLTKEKQKMVMFLNPMLHLQHRKCTIKTTTGHAISNDLVWVNALIELLPVEKVMQKTAELWGRESNL
eukprot:Gb_40976 [translate_table: standard]